MNLTSRADVSTDAPARYARQLASHLGRRLEVVEEPAATRIVFEHGECLMTPQDGSLVLQAQARDAEWLERVEGVVGRHLEKFGQRVGLAVDWVRA